MTFNLVVSRAESTGGDESGGVTTRPGMDQE
jgi:hypothetical protein